MAGPGRAEADVSVEHGTIELFNGIATVVGEWLECQVVDTVWVRSFAVYPNCQAVSGFANPCDSVRLEW